VWFVDGNTSFDKTDQAVMKSGQQSDQLQVHSVQDLERQLCVSNDSPTDQLFVLERQQTLHNQQQHINNHTTYTVKNKGWSRVEYSTLW